MRLALLAVAAAALSLSVSAQTIPARGAEGTFDVATWNLEFFGEPSQGPSDATQLRNVVAVMEQAEIDLWALQEVVDQTEWSDLLSQLQDDGYSGRLGPSVSSTPTFDQKLGFIYNTSVVQVVGTKTILSDYDYEFGYRPPFEMQARVTVDGVARTVYVITFHAKASTGSQDYARRLAAAEALKEYVDARSVLGPVILLGDFNDYLIGSTRGSMASPYDAFVQDDGYVAATLPLQQAGLNTYCTSSTCTSGDTRDHILLTADLGGLLLSADRYGELLTSVPNYPFSTSDHLPVLAQFTFMPTAGEGGPEAGPVALLPAAPTPFRTATALRFRLDAPATVRLDVVDVLGRHVRTASGTYGAGEHAVPLDGHDLAPGLYVVRLDADGLVRTRTIVRAR